MRPPLKHGVPESLSTLFTTYASYAASMMLIRSMASVVIPRELRQYIVAMSRYLFLKFHAGSQKLTLVIESPSASNYRVYESTNQIFESALIYIRTKITPSTDRLKLVKNRDAKNFTLTFDGREQIKDSFEDVELVWRFIVEKIGSERRPDSMKEKQSLELTFDKKNKDMVLNNYLPHVLETANSIKQVDRKVKIFHTDDGHRLGFSTWDGVSPKGWASIDLEHPATFDTLAMDPALKKTIIDDLNKFLKRKDFYKKIGKAWKRGYLFYGPPGTGKSSLIAAIANYLNFDIFELDLKSITSNSELRKTLLTTTRKSILVIEDIDCNVEVQGRTKMLETAKETKSKFPSPVRSGQLTPSGILNVFDGLWTNIGYERLIIFTTNHKKKIDPALLRPGRMDMHIKLSYCTPHAFRQLVSNYLGVKDHHSFGEIENLIKTAKVTPAEIAEQLLRSGEDANADGVDAAFEEIIKLLKLKKIEAAKKAIVKAARKEEDQEDQEEEEDDVEDEEDQEKEEDQEEDQEDQEEDEEEDQEEEDEEEEEGFQMPPHQRFKMPMPMPPLPYWPKPMTRGPPPPPRPGMVEPPPISMRGGTPPLPWSEMAGPSPGMDGVPVQPPLLRLRPPPS